MRLTAEQAAIIRQFARSSFGPEARVWLFGSRMDDQAMGGDIDLLIETKRKPPLRQVLRAQALLEQRLGTAVDLMTSSPDQTPSPIIEIAKLTGAPLT